MAMTHGNVKADPPTCDLNQEVLTSGSAQKEGIGIIEIINFFYFNFLNEPVRIDLEIMYESIIFYLPWCA